MGERALDHLKRNVYIPPLLSITLQTKAKKFQHGARLIKFTPYGYPWAKESGLHFTRSNETFIVPLFLTLDNDRPRAKVKSDRMEKSTKRFRKERRGQRGKCIGNNNDRQRVICRVREIKVKLGFVTGSVSLFNLRDRLSEPSFVNWNIEILWDSFSFFFC